MDSVRILFMREIQNGQFGLALIPWSLMAQDSEIEIQRSAIIGRPLRCPDQLEKAYLQQTSNIQLATGNDSMLKV